MNFRNLVIFLCFIVAVVIITAVPSFKIQPVLAGNQTTRTDHSGNPAAKLGDKDMSGMDMNTPMTPAQIRAALADQKESELKHHIAGIFIILAGLFILASSLVPQHPFLRLVWPGCFLLCGLFLLGFSDSELWPTGPLNWWTDLLHDRQALQHKVFAVILLSIGYFEVQRARGIAKAAWSKWIFPVLATCGSILLLFHEHSITMMQGMDHSAVMAHIETEHKGFAAVGAGIGISKGLSDWNTPPRALPERIFAILMIALGILLVIYTE